MVEDTGFMDKAKGKMNQVAGDLKGDKSQSLKGHGQELRGDIKGKLTDRDNRI